MYLLSDNEIKALGKKAEEHVRFLRLVSHKKEISGTEDPQEVTEYLLKDIYHLEDDVKRLFKVVKQNLDEMNWFDNCCYSSWRRIDYDWACD